MLTFILTITIFIIFLITQVPSWINAPKNELYWRMSLALPLPCFIALYWLRKKSRLAYEIGIPCTAFIRNLCAVMLYYVLAKEKKIEPTQILRLTVFQIVYYVYALAVCNNVLLCSILIIVFFVISYSLQIRLVNQALFEKF